MSTIHSIHSYRNVKLDNKNNINGKMRKRQCNFEVEKINEENFQRITV